VSKLRARILFSVIGILFSAMVIAQPGVVTLHVPIIEETPFAHQFYHDLLTRAIRETGQTPQLVVKTYPQLRIKKLLEMGEISVYWMINSDDRNKRFHPIPVGLTNGLIGKRVLLIRPGDQHRYENIHSLEDFRTRGLIGGMGKHWYDAKVWQANRLRYLELSGNWKFIFGMVSLGRSFDYFSRGVNEIVPESALYPDLEIEQKLLLEYTQDFRFYLSKSGDKAGNRYHAILSRALNKARESGLIEALIQKHWGKDLKSLNIEQRTTIHLHSP